MKLYILGNGFDMAHGFKTSYQSFREYLIRKDRYDILYLFPDEDLWSDFEYNVCAIDHESFKELVKEYKDISEVICEEIFDEIANEMANFLKQIEYDINPIYDIDKSSLFFVFNYTHTLEMIYDVNPLNIYQPHGSIADYLNFDNRLILGHHEHEYLANPELTSGKYFDYYYKFSLYTEKPVQKIIKSKEMIEFANKIDNNKIDEVVLFGFSYSSVDIDYIKEIREHLHEDTLFLMGYHTENDKNNALRYIEELNIKNYKIKKNELIIKRIRSEL